MCTILIASFFHFEQKVRTSPVGPNCKPVIEVVKFIMVFVGFEKALKPPEEISKMLTVPILLPVARCLPSWLTSIVVVWKEPSSGTLATQRLCRRSHW